MGGQRDRAAQILDRAHRQTYHEQDGKVMVNTYQDVEPHLEYAAKLRRAEREHRGAFGKRNDMHHKMSVPFNVIAQAAQKLGIQPGATFQPDNMKQIMKELKRPEYKAFRTTNDKGI